MAFTKDIGLKNFYDRYCERSILKGREPKSYKVFSNVIKSFNKKFRHELIYNSQVIKLPYYMGDMYIKKFINNYTEDNKHIWRVNYIESKKTGKIVYFGDKYGYTFKWHKKDCKVKGKRWFKFKPCRAASRMIADAIKNKNIDYYN